MKRVLIASAVMCLAVSRVCSQAARSSSYRSSPAALQAAAENEAAHGLDLATCKWEGSYQGQGAVMDRLMFTAYMPNTRSFNCTWEDDVAAWPSKDGHCNGVLCVAWKDADGEWHAAYVEHKPQGSGYNFTNNDSMNYYSSQPAVGDIVGIFTLSYDKTKRSSVFFTRWGLRY